MDQQARMEFVEEFALSYGDGTTSRIAGRIFAYLLTDDAPHLSLQELATELGVSKASISTNTRILIAHRMIRRVAVVGSRMEHYGLDTVGITAALHSAARTARAVSELASRGRALHGQVVSPGSVALRELEDVYSRLAEAIETVAAT